MTTALGPIDHSLRHRANLVVPGGMYGHMRAGGLPEGYPQFFARGEGCHLWDVDGRKYLDFMCSWGPIVLGHRHPAVDAAARRHRRAGAAL
jgi:glutamate-1-semialdehyde 2,1-aminomutase